MYGQSKDTNVDAVVKFLGIESLFIKDLKTEQTNFDKLRKKNEKFKVENGKLKTKNV